MIDLKVNIAKLDGFVNKETVYAFEPQLMLHQGALLNKTGKGNDFLGWISLPDEIDDAMLSSIESDAKEIASKADIYVVIGIGGSYLGARAVIEALQHNFAGLQLRQFGEFSEQTFTGERVVFFNFSDA